MTREIRRLCVYCGSAVGNDPQFRAAAAALGAGLAERGIELVYGGGRSGLMGVLADAVLSGGGRVTGVIPAHLQHRELAHPRLDELVVVADMHQRKRVMAERADAFAVLPGGVGTLDETIEILSWRQLDLHEKPIIVVDVGGYWRPLAALFEHVAAAGFSTPLIPDRIRFVGDVGAVLQFLSAPR